MHASSFLVMMVRESFIAVPAADARARASA